jgi:hypothetical protein
VNEDVYGVRVEKGKYKGLKGQILGTNLKDRTYLLSDTMDIHAPQRELDEWVPIKDCSEPVNLSLQDANARKMKALGGK